MESHNIEHHKSTFWQKNIKPVPGRPYLRMEVPAVTKLQHNNLNSKTSQDLEVSKSGVWEILHGLEEAVSSGKALKDAQLTFDVAFTSLLTRAQQTLEIIKKEIGQPDLPTVEHWRLNERHYGDLTGYNKEEMAAKYGLEQVQIWRRKFDVLPPPMEKDHKYYKSIVENSKFQNQPDIQIPDVESLETSMVRTLPFWRDAIVPAIQSGKRVLIVTHGTTLRGLVKHIDGIGNEEIMKLNLPTGMPFYYVLDENLKPVISMQFYSDRETVEKAMALVASISHKSP